jgi:hypothetical protein
MHTLTDNLLDLLHKENGAGAQAFSLPADPSALSIAAGAMQNNPHLAAMLSAVLSAGGGGAAVAGFGPASSVGMTDYPAAQVLPCSGAAAHGLVPASSSGDLAQRLLLLTSLQQHQQQQQQAAAAAAFARAGLPALGHHGAAPSALMGAEEFMQAAMLAQQNDGR